MAQTSKLYTGIKELVLPDEDIAKFYENKLIIDDLRINQYVFIEDSDGHVLDKRMWNGTSLEKIKFKRMRDFKPKTDKQECCFDLLNRDSIPGKIIFGCAGAGKTKMALKFGFDYLKDEKVRRIMLLRHNVSLGEKNGYLKGTKEEKILGWLGCIQDNLVLILSIARNQ